MYLGIKKYFDEISVRHDLNLVEKIIDNNDVDPWDFELDRYTNFISTGSRTWSIFLHSCF
jgi:hypothetical protein